MLDSIRLCYSDIQNTFNRGGGNAYQNLNVSAYSSFSERVWICRFAMDDARRKHELVHSDEKLFQCTYCQKRFKHSRWVANHEKTHFEQVTLSLLVNQI